VNELVARQLVAGELVPGQGLDGHARRGRAGAGRWRSLAGRALREPFLHFLLLGGALFLFSHHLEERARFTRIVVTKAQVQGIADNYRLQYGSYPSATQLDSLVEGYIREAVFYHEAQKLGLDKGDEIIRRRLVQKYEFLQQDLGIAHEPAETELRAWYQAHPQQYLAPARATFTHVYFSVDRRGEQGAQSAAKALAAQLEASGATRAADAGDRFPGPQDFAGLAQPDAARVFGKDGLAVQLYSLPPGHWSAPLRSGLGWHVVYVDGQEAARPAPFDEVRDNVRRDFLESARAARNAEAYARLQRGFEIVRE
jgi:hypothetical protein